MRDCACSGSRPGPGRARGGGGHFGSKDALVTAVIERALSEHARQQLLALRAVAATPDASIEAVVRAWISPHLLVIGRGGLIADTSVDEFVRSGSRQSVHVRSPHVRHLVHRLDQQRRRLRAVDVERPVQRRHQVPFRKAVLGPRRLGVQLVQARDQRVDHRVPDEVHSASGDALVSHLTTVAAGQSVALVQAEAADYYQWPDIRNVPIRDAEPSRWALVWRTGAETPLVRAFAQAAADVAE